MSEQGKLPDPFGVIASRLKNWRPEVIFDFGANVGQSALDYARAYPECVIHSFEPVPDTYETLTEAVSSFPNISPHRIALGKASGTVPMRLSRTSTQSRIVPDGAVDLADPRVVEVEAKTGSQAASDLGIDRISFLKIDTEGHDFDVLIGFAPILQNVDFVQVEAAMNPHNRTHVPFRLMEDFLRSQGFLLFYIFEQWFEFHKGGKPVMRRSNPLFINGKMVDLKGIS